ncbi:MAG: hypothetical protein MRY57_01850 [Candidatus Pacebacteria bacterium]|nr:hypothetical protein [Candidatus Paceibacterota bacterium]
MGATKTQKTAIQVAMENALKNKNLSNKIAKEKGIELSPKKQREAENIRKSLERKKFQDKARATSKKVQKAKKFVENIPTGKLSPKEMLNFAIDKGYLTQNDLIELPHGKELPLKQKLGNANFNLYRIYPGMRALVFVKQIKGKKEIKQVKFFRTMSANTKIQGGKDNGILNVSIFASFDMINDLSLLEARDVLRVNGEIRKKTLKGSRSFHNLDLTLLPQWKKVSGRIVVSPYPKKGNVRGWDNPKNQGGSIIRFND